MTFNPLAALNCVEVSNLINKQSKVIDIGSQTPSLGPDLFERLINKYNFLDNQQILNLKNLKKEIINKKNISTKKFFLSLNFSNYESIDVNGAYNSFLYDLNFDLIEKYDFNQVYDLVINNGTGEHVFNQFSLLKNIHQLCKASGIMLHILPFIDWINHGFYNFNPIFFADLAASNNYDIVKISLANRNGDEIIFDKNYYHHAYEQVKPKIKESFFAKTIDLAKDKLGKNIIIVCALQKLDKKKFIIPLQGKYLEDIENKDLKIKYEKQKLGSSKAINQVADNKKRERL